MNFSVMRFHLAQRFASVALPALLATVIMPTAIAQTRTNAEILLAPTEEESYRIFIARAEANAAVKVQTLFDQDLLRTEVRVTVLGQRSAAIAPVLRLQVSRREWTEYPDPETWSQYFPESSRLLLFNPPLAPIANEDPDADADSEATAGDTSGQEANGTGTEQVSTPQLGLAADGTVTILQQTPGEISPAEIKAAIEAGTLTEANFVDLDIADILAAIDADKLVIIKQEDL